jgi:hypothetical protein
MGSVNDVAQMCPFLRGFRKPINDFLAFLEMHEGRPSPSLHRSEQTCSHASGSC